MKWFKVFKVEKKKNKKKINYICVITNNARKL